MANIRPHAIIDFFAASGMEIDETQASRFFDFYRLLVEHNESRDLTRITGFEDIAVKHFIDCAYITRIVLLPESLLDIGSGAGFPGIPLKIVSPGTNIILAEHRPRRVEFMRLVIRELGLTGIDVYPHLVSDKSYFTVDGIVTRALESIPETLERVCHFLPRNGIAIFMKGPSVDGEMENNASGETEDFQLEMDERYRLPGTTYDRRLILYRKITARMERTYRIMRNTHLQQGSAITSTDNTKFKELKKIATPEGMRKTGKVLVSGKKIVGELIEEGKTIHHLVLCDGYRETDRPLLGGIESAAEAGNLLILKKSLFNELDDAGTGSPMVTLDLPALRKFESLDAGGCILAVPFQDPANVGGVIRSAVGLGISSVLVMKESASPFHPKAVRASAGAVFRADLYRGPSLRDLEEAAARRGITLVALDRSGSPLEDFVFPERFILLPGMEGPGLPENLRKNSLSIAMMGGVESLNGPVAAAIAMYRWSQNRK